MGIGSEIELPELNRTDKEPQVFVKIGKVKDGLETVEKSGVRFCANRNEFILNLNTIGSFYVKGGNEIIVEPKKDVEDRAIRIFLLGSAFGALLHQRGHFVFHASTVEYKNHAVCVSGVSGAGKSTLAKALNNKGYKIISDDVTVVEFDGDDKPFVLPGLRRVKLWQDAAEKLGESFSEEKAIRKNVNKYTLNVQLPEGSTELKYVFILEPYNKDELEVSEIQSFQKVNELIKNTYRFSFISNSERKRHLEQCGKIANNVKMYKIFRPRKGFTLEKQIEIIKGIMD